jgi:hypothetical protein
MEKVDTGRAEHRFEIFMQVATLAVGLRPTDTDKRHRLRSSLSRLDSRHVDLCIHYRSGSALLTVTNGIDSEAVSPGLTPESLWSGTNAFSWRSCK